MTPTNRREFLDVEFDVLSVEELISRISETRSDGPYRYLVTPNVDHLVRLHRNGAGLGDLAGIYRDADFCVCDSKVLARLAKWRSVDLPVIPGSDLTERLFEEVIQDGDRIAIIGGDAEMLSKLSSKYPKLEFGQHRPPMGLVRNSAARREAGKFIADTKPRFTFVCVGAPQQEMIAAEAAMLDGSGGLALCVGAALEFLTDRQKRAPVLMRRFGLEWAHRLLSNPRRLWRRYLIEGPAIFILAYRWRRSRA